MDDQEMGELTFQPYADLMKEIDGVTEPAVESPAAVAALVAAGTSGLKATIVVPSAAGTVVDAGNVLRLRGGAPTAANTGQAGLASGS